MHPLISMSFIKIFCLSFLQTFSNAGEPSENSTSELDAHDLLDDGMLA